MLYLPPRVEDLAPAAGFQLHPPSSSSRPEPQRHSLHRQEPGARSRQPAPPGDRSRSSKLLPSSRPSMGGQFEHQERLRDGNFNFEGILNGFSGATVASVSGSWGSSFRFVLVVLVILVGVFTQTILLYLFVPILVSGRSTNCVFFEEANVSKHCKWYTDLIFCRFLPEPFPRPAPDPLRSFFLEPFGARTGFQNWPRPTPPRSDIGNWASMSGKVDIDEWISAIEYRLSAIGYR